MKNPKHIAAGASVIALAGVILGGTAGAASAAPATSTVKAKAAVTAHAKPVAKKPQVHRAAVSKRAITRYHLTGRQVHQIHAANRLANTSKAKSIRWRESNGIYSIVGNGYYGAWQFDRGTWLANGGGKFAPTANKAPKWAQDYVMWKTHNVRGWQPWGG